jgi:hypothetical protein
MRRISQAFFLLACSLAIATSLSANSPREAASEESGGLIDQVKGLPVSQATSSLPPTDWLLDPSPFRARVERSEDASQVVLTNGLITRRFAWQPNLATVGIEDATHDQQWLRAIQPEAIFTLDGKPYAVGGLTGPANPAFLGSIPEGSLQSLPGSMQVRGFRMGPVEPRMGWKRNRHHQESTRWPPSGVHLQWIFDSQVEGADLQVVVHYEMYDGLPAWSKWVTVEHRGGREVRIDRCISEKLSVVEWASEVDDLSSATRPPSLHIETDMAMGGMMSAGANRRSFRWLPDPDYATQVNYKRLTPCMLEVGPDLGPAATLKSGDRFESLRCWVLPTGTDDRERQGLAVRRLTRTIAPWVTENPLMMHCRFADPESVRRAIDQCADVGFEMVILTFGSGFDIESTDPQVLKRAKEYSQYAASKGIEIGCYSLLASRSVGQADDVVMPSGEKPAFGQSPCLCSRWGEEYFAKLRTFYQESGFRLLEHDGSYPGDPCASTLHPGHRGLEDSRWRQWESIRDFYRWCRQEGIYLNVPDYYFLSGSNKTGMGYRETNWSLPREQQVIHTRQNIFDGTWEKQPSMGWMFVPLTEYHGGGAAATIEPLREHLDHYRTMLESNLALGVQACYRGPQLYDTQETREMVAAQVAWFKKYRRLLEADLIHGRRADGTRLDWMLHLLPEGKDRGMLVVFNPTQRDRSEELQVPLYYSGLQDQAFVRPSDGEAVEVSLDSTRRARMLVTVPAGKMAWWVIGSKP